MNRELADKTGQNRTKPILSMVAESDKTSGQKGVNMYNILPPMSDASGGSVFGENFFGSDKTANCPFSDDRTARERSVLNGV